MKKFLVRYKHKLSDSYMLNQCVADKELSDIYKTNTNFSFKPGSDEQALT
jgi:hypothetical protein